MMGIVNRYRTHLAVFMAFILGFAAAGMLRPAPASAFDLDDLLGKGVKIVGVKLLVDQFGGELNKFINNFLDNNDARSESASSCEANTSSNPISGRLWIWSETSMIPGPCSSIASAIRLRNSSRKVSSIVPSGWRRES